MRELSLNILDIAQNSISANASLIEIEIIEDTVKNELTIGIYDNGKGITEEQVEAVQDQFFTTRTTRKVGMGVPLFKLAAEQTGGGLSIVSQLGKGTRVTTVFKTDSIDFTPLGDINSTILTLITMNTDRDFIYKLRVDEKEFVLSTSELKEILGDVPLNEPSISQWIKEYLNEQTSIIRGGVNK
ncbi:MAG: ATP-binding protein [Ruminococcus sp.]|nr:ATP-binding protein [Candidatus Copronaster equi]